MRRTGKSWRWLFKRRKERKKKKEWPHTRVFLTPVSKVEICQEIWDRCPSWLHIFSVNKAYIWAISVYFSQVDIVILHAGEASKNCFLGTGSPKSVSPQKAFTHFRCKLGNFANYALLLDFWPPKLWLRKFHDQFHVCLCRVKEYSTPGALSCKCTLQVNSAHCTVP